MILDRRLSVGQAPAGPFGEPTAPFRWIWGINPRYRERTQRKGVEREGGKGKRSREGFVPVLFLYFQPCVADVPQRATYQWIFRVCIRLSM